MSSVNNFLNQKIFDFLKSEIHKYIKYVSQFRVKNNSIEQITKKKFSNKKIYECMYENLYMHSGGQLMTRAKKKITECMYERSYMHSRGQTNDRVEKKIAECMYE